MTPELEQVIAYLPGKQRPCCMYCTAQAGHATSASDVVLHVGLLVTYTMALEMSLPNPSNAYDAQAVCSSATQQAVPVA